MVKARGKADTRGEVTGTRLEEDGIGQGGDGTRTKLIIKEGFAPKGRIHPKLDGGGGGGRPRERAEAREGPNGREGRGISGLQYGSTG